MAGKRVKPELYKKLDLSNSRVSTCGVCRRGVFKKQDYQWFKDYGLIHTPCIPVDSS